MAFDEALHARGTGDLGGQFVAKGAAPAKTAPVKKTAGKARPSSKAAAGAGVLSFDGKHGTGYGKPGGDKRVKGLQAALNKLGLTDGAGNALKEDGKLGPKTTAAIKKAQRQLGLKPDGKVTPAVLAKILAAKSAKKSEGKPSPKKAATAKRPPVKKAARPAKRVPAKAKPLPKALAKQSPSKRAALVKKGT